METFFEWIENASLRMEKGEAGDRGEEIQDFFEEGDRADEEVADDVCILLHEVQQTS